MRDNPRRGTLLMVATSIIFAIQDGISRYLARSYDIITIAAILYRFFAIFVCAFSACNSGGFKQAAATRQPWLRAGRGALLPTQICLGALGLSQVGLVQFHAIFASYPLMVVVLSVPFWPKPLAGGGGWLLAVNLPVS